MAMTVLGAWSCPSAQTLSVSARELVHLCRFLYEPLPPAALAPGDGPAAKVSVSLRTGNIRAVRERVTAFVREAQDNDFRVVVSAMARIEARGVRVESDRLRWYLSRLKIEPVTEDISSRAIELLCDARLHGHKYAIDAVVAATALRSVRPAIVLTSDEDDMKKLCGKTVQVVPV